MTRYAHCEDIINDGRWGVYTSVSLVLDEDGEVLRISMQYGVADAMGHTTRVLTSDEWHWNECCDGNVHVGQGV